MVTTPSTMLPLGTVAPAFALPNAVDAKIVTLDELTGGPALLVMFVCNHCPYVIHVRDEFPRIARDYDGKGLRIVAINSNSMKTHPEDGPENMRVLVRELGWTFPFLFDETQEVAKAYRAACTPDFFLFDASHKLTYRGQLDDARPKNTQPVNGKDLRAAIDATLEGRSVANQKASLGCNIKWHPESEPDYFPPLTPAR